MRFDKCCSNWDGDEDCNKCCVYGIIYCCPDPCEYSDSNNQKEVKKDECE